MPTASLESQSSTALAHLIGWKIVFGAKTNMHHGQMLWKDGEFPAWIYDDDSPFDGSRSGTRLG